MKFQPEDFDKIRSKKLALAIRRLNSDKPLTASQEKLLTEEEARVRGGGAELAPGGPGYVGTWDELAQRLGVTARAIRDWRDDPRYAPVIKERWRQLVRADERKCVAEWLRLMVDLHLKRGKAPAEATDDPENDRDEESDLIQPPRYGGRETDWAKAKVAKDVERKTIEIDSIKGTLLEAVELEVPLGATFAAIQTKLAQFPARVARYLVGLRDVGEVEDRLRDEIDADLSDLHAARYTAEDAVAAAVAGLPFDEESDRLFKLVTFDGQDRTTLLHLITAVASQALRQLGRRAAATALREKETPDTALADEATGQVTDEAAARESASRQATPVPSASASGDRCRNARPVASSVSESPPVVEGTPTTPVRAKQSRPKAGRRRKARPQPTSPPPAIEAAIVNTRTKAAKKRRR